jgi:LPS sulfotransferase NodH
MEQGRPQPVGLPPSPKSGAENSKMLTATKPTAEKPQTELSLSGQSDNPSSGPLFVVGMWRSGTSLLYALLNQHPEIKLMYEDDLPLLWPLFIGGKAKQDWFARWNFWNSAPQRHKIDANIVSAAAPSLKAALESIYKGQGSAIWGAKSPNYYDSMVSLSRIFPNARFIIIWRNLEGICSSVARAGQKPSWFTRAGMMHRTILGYQRMKLERERLAEAGVEVHDIHYERLVSDPTETMQGICEFLKIRFTPQMCSLVNADRSAVFNHGHHELVNSSKIVSSQDRPETLSQPLKKKIARYTRLWKEEDGEPWTTCEDNVEGDRNKPSHFERLKDRLIYRALRAYDLAIVFIYCYSPMFVLRGYRSLKHPPAPLVTEKLGAPKTSRY